MDGDEGPPLKPPDATAAPTGGDGEQQRDREDGSQPAPSLPDDVLADIFGRLAPRWVAASRCVCRSWCASIDARRLLRADLLPLSLRGIFVHFDMHKFPAFFSRPTAPGAPACSGKLSFLPSADPDGCFWLPDETYDSREKYNIKDHCNGLLLIDKYVVNPATRRWDALPPAPPARVHFIIRGDQALDQGTPVYETIHNYLVFDPTVSPHYQVLRICALSRMGSLYELRKSSAECPSPVCTLNVLSSRTGCWEERRFVREGDAAGVVPEVRARPQSGAVYWRGALYVHRESHFVLRISLSDSTYRVIKPPSGFGANSYSGVYLERSEKGVYFVSLDKYLLRVWILEESSGQMDWVLKHDKDLEPLLARRRPQRVHGPWMLKGINHNSFCTHFPEDNMEDTAEEMLEWSSDNDVVLDNEDAVQGCSSKECYSNNDSDVLGNEDTIEECCSEDSKKEFLEENFESDSNVYMVDSNVGMVGAAAGHKRRRRRSSGFARRADRGESTSAEGNPVLLTAVNGAPVQGATSPLPVGQTCHNGHQLVVNSKSVLFDTTRTKCGSFLRSERKLVVFRNFAPNVVVLCYILETVTLMQKIDVRSRCSGFTHTKRSSSSVNQPRKD